MNFKASAVFKPMNVQAMVARSGKAVRLSCEQSAEAVLETAESLVNVDTGALRESGHSLTTKTETGFIGEVIFPRTYARYVEEGTGQRGEESPGAGPGPFSPDWPGMPANPYARDALQIEKVHILEIFQDNVAIANKLGGS